MRRYVSPSQGFTLLEVLIAVAVFAILSTVSYAGLMRMLDGRARVEAERQQWSVLATTFTLIEDDLGNARPRTVYDPYGNVIAAFIGRPVDPRPMGPSSMEFTRGGAFPGSGAISDLSRVEYVLSENKLIRRIWETLDQVAPNKPSDVVLLKDVDNLTTRFYSPQTGWNDRWPVDPNAGLLSRPTAVEIAFDVKGIGRLTRLMMVGE
jgi:general secretion pathway protein J